LNSGELADGTGLEYRPGSYHTFGIDGSVQVNGSIDDPVSTALPGFSNRTTILTLLRTVSDHLPVVADYTFPRVQTVNNLPPTDLVLTGTSVIENATVGTTVGTLTSVDPDADNTFTYSLVSGVGSQNNASFTIVGNTLRVNGPINFETTPTMSVRVRTTDQGGLFFEESLVISVLNVREAAVTRQRLFYNRATGSLFGNGAGNPVGAIDDSKRPLLPGQASSFLNYTNYIRGLNGLVVDIESLGSATASDFQFSTWNGIDAAGFVTTTATPTVSVIPGGGSGGESRVKIEFADGAIKNTWLRVTVMASDTTDLAANNVFYFGNAIGDMNAGNSSDTPQTVRVNAIDSALVRLNQATGANEADITNIYDIDKSGRVNAIDSALVRLNQANPLIRNFEAPIQNAPRSMSTRFFAPPIASLRSTQIADAPARVLMPIIEIPKAIPVIEIPSGTNIKPKQDDAGSSPVTTPTGDFPIAMLDLFFAKFSV